MKYKKKLSMFAITIMLLLFGVMNTLGEQKMKSSIIDMKAQCSNVGYEYISEVYSQDNRICIECVNIQGTSSRTVVSNIITICGEDTEYYF